MALAHSPKIATDGLVFAYDMGNTRKSWRGAPTTNLITASLSGMSGVTLTYLGMDDSWKKYYDYEFSAISGENRDWWSNDDSELSKRHDISAFY